MANIKTQIENLERGNYQPWKYGMSNYLMGKSLWGLALRIDIKSHANINNPNENIRRDIRDWEETLY